VLLRDVGIAGYLRVTIGTEGDNDAFLAACPATHRVPAEPEPAEPEPAERVPAEPEPADPKEQRV
jgi:hypothetical protein